MIHQKRLLDSFLRLVAIDSETGNEKAISQELAAQLQALGGVVFTDEAGARIGSNGSNVYARFDGSLAGEILLYAAHMDTVKPGNGVKPRIENGIIRTDGSTVLGGDDKSGIAGILEAIRAIRENNLPHRSFEVVFTLSEEGGLHGAKNLDYSRLSAKYGLAFDSSGAVGKIITQAPGQIKIRAQVIGKTSHAGLTPEQGISAIQAAAAGVNQMKLLRIDEETTANIGVFKAEYATNIVPDRVSIVAEARSRSLQKLEAQAAHMVQALENGCRQFGATLDCRCETNYTGYHIPDDHPLVAELCDAIRALGIEPKVAAGGGGSDTNIFNQHGIPSVVLATGMACVHTTDEYLEIEQLENTARLALRLMTTAR